VPPRRISTERNRCSIGPAVWYELISSARWRLSADTPSFWFANNQQTTSTPWTTPSAACSRPDHRRDWVRV